MHVVGVAVLSLFLSASPGAEDGTADRTLKAIAQLEGNWTADGKSEAALVDYRVIGDGAAVLETVLSADRRRVLSATVFRIDGKKGLVAERYGPTGQLEQLSWKKADASSATFQGFELGWTDAGQLTRVGPDGKAVQYKRAYVNTLK